MRIYAWELLIAVCHQPETTIDHKHFDSGNRVFLICHVTLKYLFFLVTSQIHVIEGPHRSSTLYVATLPSYLAIGIVVLEMFLASHVV